MKKKSGIFKVIVIVAVVFLVLFTVVSLWWDIPVSFLNGVEAQKIAYIEVRDGSNGKTFQIREAEDIAFIVDNIQGRHLYKSAISLGYVGTWFNLIFYDDSGRCVEQLTLNFYNTLRKDPFFYQDRDEGLCIDYLCELELELAGAWDEPAEK